MDTYTREDLVYKYETAHADELENILTPEESRAFNAARDAWVDAQLG